MTAGWPGLVWRPTWWTNNFGGRQALQCSPYYRRSQEVGMDFGINVDFAVRQGCTHDDAFRESMAVVDLAEETGLDTVWLGEGHFRPARSVLSAPIVVASASTSRPQRLRVGLA